jgi:hypothetical protein
MSRLDRNTSALIIAICAFNFTALTVWGLTKIAPYLAGRHGPDILSLVLIAAMIPVGLTVVVANLTRKRRRDK